MTTLTKNKIQLDQQELEQRVKKMYKDVALHPERTYHFEMGRPLAEKLGYPKNVLDEIPLESIDSFAGVGYFFDLARIQKGEIVADLGSGSGMDVFYAATKVGQSGEVIGLDMTQEQLEKSKKLKDKFQFRQVFFLESYIEQLNVVSECIDVVISNGVINLSNQKAKVFEEVSRILKPGGRLALSDIVTETKLPENITCNASLWAACIGGAIPQEQYISMIEDAGLEIVKIKDNPYQFLSEGAQGATREYGIKSISILARKPEA